MTIMHIFFNMHRECMFTVCHFNRLKCNEVYSLWIKGAGTPHLGAPIQIDKFTNQYIHVVTITCTTWHRNNRCLSNMCLHNFPLFDNQTTDFGNFQIWWNLLYKRNSKQSSLSHLQDNQWGLYFKICIWFNSLILKPVILSFSPWYSKKFKSETNGWVFVKVVPQVITVKITWIMVSNGLKPWHPLPSLMDKQTS